MLMNRKWNVTSILFLQAPRSRVSQRQMFSRQRMESQKRRGGLCEECDFGVFHAREINITADGCTVSRRRGGGLNRQCAHGGKRNQEEWSRSCTFLDQKERDPNLVIRAQINEKVRKKEAYLSVMFYIFLRVQSKSLSTQSKNILFYFLLYLL